MKKILCTIMPWGISDIFLEHDFVIKISTIAIAEYCVRGDVSELPLKNMLIVPFNFDHAQRAGKMIAEVYAEKGDFAVIGG